MAGITGTVPPHINHFNDIGDVNVPAPVDGYFVYWDAAAGRWQCQHVVTTVDHLNDIGDVNVPAPADQYFLYWDNAAGRWQCRALIDADIPATIARDAEVVFDIATHTALPNAHHAQDHAASHEPGGGDAMAVDAIAATGSLRTLGVGAQQAMQGNATPIPAAHAASHENGGGDEVSVLGLSGLLADGQTPLAHAASHEPGGGDAMAVDAIAATGSLRTLGVGAQQAMQGNATPTPAAHAASHENGGGDEVSVLGLSGLLADGQTPLAHAASHEPGGGDAMAVDAIAATGSLRTLGVGAQQAMQGNATPTPAAHAASHENGGGDEVSVLGLSGLLADGQTPLAHAASHNWLGSDQLEFQNAFIMNSRIFHCDWQAADYWTQVPGGTGSISIDILNTLLATGATSGGSARLYTTALGWSLGDSVLQFLVSPWNVPSAQTVWLIFRRGGSTVGDVVEHCGFKVINESIYASVGSQAGVQTIEDTGVDWARYDTLSLAIRVPDDELSVEFYVNDVLTNTITTNLPRFTYGLLVLYIESTDNVTQTLRSYSVGYYKNP